MISSGASIEPAISSFGDADRRALVQRVPPLHREVDDRHIDDPDERQHGAGAIGAPRIVNRRLQGDETNVEKQQNQASTSSARPRPTRCPMSAVPKASRSPRERNVNIAPVIESDEAIIDDTRALKTQPTAA